MCLRFRIHSVNSCFRSGNLKKYIETSICISPVRKNRVTAAAKVLHVRVSDVLDALMRKSRIVFCNDHARLWKAVQYQLSSPHSRFCIWHVSLLPLCYEFGVSERLFFKVSVSRIYAVAIDAFLDDLVENGLDSITCNEEIPTNYSKGYYNITYSGEPKTEKWTICWNRRIKMKKKRKKKRK